jgi:hypothetical protein
MSLDCGNAHRNAPLSLHVTVRIAIFRLFVVVVISFLPPAFDDFYLSFLALFSLRPDVGIVIAARRIVPV